VFEQAAITFPWGKSQDGGLHHLAHHMADVAACFETLCAMPVIRQRIERAAGGRLTETSVARLAVVAFLHDCGKLHPGFQAKGWPEKFWNGPLHGHVAEGAAIFSEAALAPIARNLHLDALISWGVDEHLLFASLAHHGRPFAPSSQAGEHWTVVAGYDAIAASAEIGAMMREWFPSAFAADSTPLPSTPDFQHLFCGFVSLADWLGSDRRSFAFVGALDPAYMGKARDLAGKALSGVHLDARAFQSAAQGRARFDVLTGLREPRPQQRVAAEHPLDDPLIILEAETGAGKTEAALWRFARLFEAGLVDSLYFALPTRAAAIQIHGRVNRAMARLFGVGAPEAVLAVPGYIKAGDAPGQSLPDWRVRWDDNPDEERRLSRWAAESAKRSLAAMIAVGTVDQAMLAALQVKHAHLRSAALSRSFLVIDEVHASDRYMTEVQGHLLEMHLRRSGRAMLMSATLGSVARVKWLGGRSAPDFEQAAAAPYPAVWGKRNPAPQGVDGSQCEKTVAMELAPTMAAEEAARLATEAAKQGARVLVIRNTVTAAVSTWAAVRANGEDGLLLQVGGAPALHHSRFAPEDRALLDGTVERALLPDPARGQGGVIVIGTQTLEQSLDIDADLLITDLCPVDVLLQRIGRLHRHTLPRPAGFAGPRCIVLTPEKGLEPLLKPAFENGLGGWISNGVLLGVYRDLSILELTRRLVEGRAQWTIPAMNRWLVESATHQEKIDALHAEMGATWSRYWNDVYGKDVADAGAARRVILPVTEPFAEVKFASDEEKIRTRLGGEGVRLEFAPVEGPFGQLVGSFTLPEHWSRGIDASAPVAEAVEGGLRISAGDGARFIYDRRGLSKEKP
jgi:CRISPR-associated endonuclease/helicase Cas3